MTAPDVAKTIRYYAAAAMAICFGGSALIVAHGLAYTLGQFNRTLVTINRPCSKDQSCGTLADVAKTLNTIRGTAGQIEIAAKHENGQLSTLDAQERELFADLHAVTVNAQQLTASLTRTSDGAGIALASLNADLLTVDETMKAAQPVLDSTAMAAKSATAAADQVTKILSTAAIPDTLTHVASMTNSGDRILKDGADEADKLTHPPKVKLTFWGALWAVEQKIKSGLPPLF